MSLYTGDLERAQPLLSHETKGSGNPIPWKSLQKPPLAEVPMSRAHTHYPPASKNRVRDLSLTTHDIEGCVPRGVGLNCEGKRRQDVPVDPLNPAYAMPSSDARAPTPVSGRKGGPPTLDVSDIEGTKPSHAVPVRSHYGNIMHVEDEFRSWRHNRALMENRSLGTPGRSHRNGPSPRKQLEEAVTPRQWELPQKPPLTPRREGPQRSARSTDPLDPQYRVPWTDCPTLNVMWAEEKRSQEDAPPEVESRTIGRVEGSLPRKPTRDNGEPFFSLQADDIRGANPKRRIGAMPYNMYDAYGRRPQQSSSLDTKDIKGAQADTLIRQPKVKRKPLAETAARNLKTGDGDFELMFADAVVDR